MKNEIIREVADIFGTTPQEMKERRFKNVKSANLVCYKIFRLAGYSYPQIGRIMGRDHTTVVCGITNIEKNPELVKLANELARKYKLIKPKKEAEANMFRITYNREQVRNELNKGLSFNDIAKRLNIPLSFVHSQVSYFERKNLKKYIPDYKKSTTKVIYM